PSFRQRRVVAAGESLHLRQNGFGSGRCLNDGERKRGRAQKEGGQPDEPPEPPFGFAHERPHPFSVRWNTRVRLFAGISMVSRSISPRPAACSSTSASQRIP